MIKEQLKFYADTPRGDKNKLFTWDVSILTLEDALFRFFAKGWNIRSAWYNKTNTETGEVENTKIPNLQQLFEKFLSLPPKEKKIYFNVPVKGQIIKAE
jgi:hypothetical protein